MLRHYLVSAVLHIKDSLHSRAWRGCSRAMIVSSAFCPAFVRPRAKRAANSRALGDFQCWGCLQQVRGALLAERAYWLVTCEIITSGPRSALRAVLLRLVPAHLFLMLEIPGDWLTGLCGRRKLLANSEIPRARLFGQRKKAGSEKLGMTLKEAVTRLGRFSHPEVLILR